MKTFFALFLTPLLGLLPPFEEEPVRLKPEFVVVVATRIPAGNFALGRSVTVISKEEIQKAAARSFPELLKHCLGLDFQERGNFGVQADLSLRASTFQQVLILVDGIRVNDLQTGHHNLDVPVPLENIERIEVLHGNGSSLYGPDAFGGVINIVTRRPEKTHFSGKFAAYDFSTLSGSFGFNVAGRKLLNIFQLEGNKSKGFREDRDFKTLTISDKFSIDAFSGKVRLFAGYGRKNFGALDFYTPGMNFPSREFTETTFLDLGYERAEKSYSLSKHIYYRTHFDRFVLDRKRPSFFTNETTNSSGGAQIIFRLKDLALGAEVAKESVQSTKLGNHRNVRGAIFMEGNLILFNRLFLNAGLREDFHKTYGQALSPSLTLACPLSPDFKVRASVGHSFRAPSYTELFYQDPVNSGNKDLRPEKAWSYEVGFDSHFFRVIEAKVSLFQRNEKDLIDWIKKSDAKWHAENIQRLRIRGFESDIRTDFGFMRIDLKSSFYSAKKNPTPFTSKYGFRFPQAQNVLSLDIKPLPTFLVSLHLFYKKRLGEQAYCLLDAKIIKKVLIFEFFLEGTNLLNVCYEDIKGVAMPGRWMGAGIKFNFPFASK